MMRTPVDKFAITEVVAWEKTYEVLRIVFISFSCPPARRSVVARSVTTSLPCSAQLRNNHVRYRSRHLYHKLPRSPHAVSCCTFRVCFNRWRVAKRPGLDAFLKEMAQLYEIVVFTDSMGGLADEVRERGGRERERVQRIIAESSNSQQ